MELRHLRSFLALAEERHFGRAARRLHIAQPALSSQIKRLERELHIPLFDRTPRGAVLTPAGETFLEHARRTVEEADRAIEAVRARARERSGHLRVGIFGHGLAELTVPVLRSFVDDRPAVRLDVRELDFLDQVMAPAAGDVDVAIVRPPLPAEGVPLVPLYTEPRVAVMASDAPLADAGSLRTADLLAEPFLAAHPDEPAVWRDYWWLVAERGGPPHTRGEGSARTVRSWLWELSVFRCVSTTAASVGRYYGGMDVAYVPIVDLAPCSVALALPADRRSPLAEEFVEVARMVAEGAVGLVAGAKAATAT